MSEPVTRDVYFWSEATGLLAMKGAAFLPRYPDANEDEPSSFIFYVDLPWLQSKMFLQAVHTCGLLWTSDPAQESRKLYPGNEIHDVHSAFFLGLSSDHTVFVDGKAACKIVVQWLPAEPFHAKQVMVPV